MLGYAAIALVMKMTIFEFLVRYVFLRFILNFEEIYDSDNPH